VHARAVLVVIQPSCAETEHPHQVGVDGRDICVDEDRDALFNGVVQHGHVLQCFQELPGSGGVVVFECGDHPGQAVAQGCADDGLVIKHFQVRHHGVVQIPAGLVECSAELGQREARVTQQADPVEPAHVGVVIELVTGRAAPRRGEQTDVVVEAHGPDRQS